MRSISRYAALLSLAFFSLTAEAAIIDNGRYTTDTVTGLDWLDLTETLGKSVNTAGSDATLSNEGWSVATLAQVQGLYQNFDLDFADGSVHGKTSADALQGTAGKPGAYKSDGVGQEQVLAHLENPHAPQFNPYGKTAFESLFGTTTRIINTANHDIHVSYSYGLHQSGTGAAVSGVAQSYYDSFAGAHDDVYIFNWLNNDKFGSSTIGTGFGYGFYGVFMVRQTAVPEPSILLLMGAGLAGLGIARRRKRQA